MIITDRHDACGIPCRWTYGTDSAVLRYGSAYPSGTVNLHEWNSGRGEYKPVRTIKCRSYRRAVRVLRWHLMGYKV